MWWVLLSRTRRWRILFLTHTNLTLIHTNVILPLWSAERVFRLMNNARKQLASAHPILWLLGDGFKLCTTLRWRHHLKHADVGEYERFLSVNIFYKFLPFFFNGRHLGWISGRMWRLCWNSRNIEEFRGFSQQGAAASKVFPLKDKIETKI